MTTIKLETKDNEHFDVDIKVANCSSTIRSMVDNLRLKDGEEEAILKLNVNSSVLRKVLEWAEHHKNDPESNKKEAEERRHLQMTTWDAQYLEVEPVTLFELILAANYLDIEGLLHVACKKVANLIKDKTVEEIRAMFNIENDLTPEEEDEIRRENEWCEEK